MHLAHNALDLIVADIGSKGRIGMDRPPSSAFNAPETAR